ncbi:hypothetical protein SUGI_0861950 [Cryptomeria japonica]|nr:hypothetical protein SUGI_0861950 [Cryptomeria japonica]
MKIKVSGRKLSYRTKVYCLLLLALLMSSIFAWIAVVTLEEVSDCSSLNCLGRRLTPGFLRDSYSSSRNIKDMYEVFKVSRQAPPGGLLVPDSYADLVDDLKKSGYDIRTFAIKLKAMIEQMEWKIKSHKLEEYQYRQIASSSIPEGLHCLSLGLSDEYSSNAHARKQLPSPELVYRLTENTYHHIVLASDNVLAASVVVSSAVRNFIKPEQLVIHIITDKKTYSAMHAWFALHPLNPAIVEVKSIDQFDWLTEDQTPVLKELENHVKVQRYYYGDHSIGKTTNDSLHVLNLKLQSRSPRYISIMNHLRIYLPELFPNLQKVVFLDDDVVVQRDISTLWDIDLQGKVNGAVETCRGKDPYVTSKSFKNYFNFSHPLISGNLDPDQCAWAYGMNIFDLNAWRRTNIKEAYHYWIRKNLESNFTLWRFGTLPPALISFNGHVHPIDPSWHMLGLGYQSKTNLDDVQQAAVIHYNGQAKPWLDIAFPHLKPFWTMYLDYSDEFIRSCNIR